MKRKNYYEYEKSSVENPVVSKSKFDHSGETIKVNNIEQLEAVALDYLSMKRGGTYYETFEFTMKMIDVLKQQDRMINELKKNFTV
jgi:hypothetical protein